MDAKTKDVPKTKDVLKQLQTELRQLQTTVSGLQKGEPAAELPTEKAEKTAKADWAVLYAVQPRASGASTPAKAGTLSFSEAQLARVPDDAAATLGNAISSPQKVALLRALLASTHGESAAALGAATGLSTGSLYHHLHDLMHAAVIGQSARNRYVLTERGRRVLLVLLALAAQS